VLIMSAAAVGEGVRARFM